MPHKLFAAFVGFGLALVLHAAPASAQTTDEPGPAPAPTAPTDGASGTEPSTGSITLDLGADGDGPSQSVVLILLLTILSIAPALLVMLTSFTRIVVVLSLTRNALGVQSIPPNQVVIGLSLFLTLFLMSPTLTRMNDQALQPYLKGDIEQSEAYDRAVGPLREFMLEQTRDAELAIFASAADEERPSSKEDVSMAALVPAFVLSELKTAFIIGFIVFVPFLVIDLVVSSSLMSMGMMMLPPVLISLPFKLLLFVMVDGWGLVVRALLSSFN